MSAPELHVNNGCEESYQYALRLADALRKKHYPDNTDWRPLGDLLGLLTQIDNMVAGLRTPTDERVKALEAENARLRDALEYIQKPQYGLQGIIEDGDSDEERANYFSAWCNRYQNRARAALRNMEGGK